MRALFAISSGKTTFLHDLDARTKMFVGVASSLSVIFMNTPQSLGFLAVVSTLYLLVLRRFALVAVCYVFILLVAATAFGFMLLMHEIWPRMAPPELGRFGIPFLRLLILANVVLALALSSRIQAVLAALRGLRLPVWLFVPTAVMIRFIPSFIKDIKEIRETMKTRGYGSGPIALISRPILTTRLLFMPLVIRALRTSDELGVAAELKGVGSRASATCHRPQRFSARDLAMALCAVGMLAVAFALQSGPSLGGGMH